MIDVVYLFGGGNGDELRYSLRSLENLEHGRVWVYGRGCEWFRGINVVEHNQIGVDKWHKSNSSLIEACKNEQISEDFILMNDDFFIMEPVELGYWYKDSLEGTLKRRKQGSYRIFLEETYRLLVENNKTTWDYSVHMPMVLNRKKVLALKERFPDVVVGRALYGNWYNVGGKKRADCKVYSAGADPPYGEFVSTADVAFKGKTGRFIKNKFIKESKYER